MENIQNKKVIDEYKEIQEYINLIEKPITFSKLKDLIKNKKILQFLSNKIPEYYLKECESLYPLYKLCIKVEDNIPLDEQILKKIESENLGIILKMEEYYPILKKIGKYLEGNKYFLHEIVTKELWNSKDIILEEWQEEYEKNKDVYENIVNHEGLLLYDNILLDDRSLERYLDKSNEDKEKLEFALKIMKYYKMTQKEDYIEPLRTSVIEREKEIQEERKNELEDLQKKLIELHDKIKKYNLIKAIFKSKEKQVLIEKEQELEGKIERIKETITYIENWIMQREEEKRYLENYKNKYQGIVLNRILPKLEEEMKIRIEKEEYPILEDIMNNIKHNYFEMKQNTNQLPSLERELLCIKENTFDEEILSFCNAITNIMIIPECVCSFEESHQDLYGLLEMIRNKLKQVPSGGRYTKLVDGYRKHNLYDKNNNDFMDHTTDYQNIEKQLVLLNEDFLELMEIEEEEEYIKKLGILWYNFMMIHPYPDGNGRTGKILLNTLLAHKNIQISSLYKNMKDQDEFNQRMDKNVLKRKKRNDDQLGEEFLNRIKEIRKNNEEVDYKIGKGII